MRLKKIGFSRYIALEWLNEAARLTKELGDPDEVKHALNQGLYEIEGEEAKRKTIDVLTRAWTRVEPDHAALRDKALEFYDSISPGDRVFLHWGVLTLAYPVFNDVVEQIGRLSNLQGYVTVNQVTRNIKKEWGDRTTLNRTVGRIFQSLNNWEVVEKENPYYRPCSKIATNRSDLETWLITTILAHMKPKPVNYQDLINHPALFPFKISTTLGQLQKSPEIETISQGSNLYLLKKK